MTTTSETNADLVGKRYKNGDDGVVVYEVTAVDREFPEIVHFKNTLTGYEGCSLGVFVRPFVLPVISP